MDDRVLNIGPLPLVLESSFMLIMHSHSNQTAKYKAGFPRVPNVVGSVLRPATSNSSVTRRRLRGHPKVQFNVQLLLGSQSLNA